ncbi:MAG: TolB family protein [Solirubrobacterales bacterium]
MSAVGLRLAAALAVVALAAPAAARAEFGPIQLVSKSFGEQAAEARATALSADGRYLAFQGAIGGVKGVFRKDLQSGALDLVAGASAYGGPPPADAAAPSISADGRFVSFTTRASLDPVDDVEAGTPDVYVADLAEGAPRYVLASAEDGSAGALPGGSAASGRVALSADGTEVVFVHAGQVYLRDLPTQTTILVSTARDRLSGEMEPGTPVPGGAVLEKPQLPLLRGAALSPDGSTVAWLGTDLPDQVPMEAGEAAALDQLDAGSFPYVEPLWRRLADGPDAPTRRVVGPMPALESKNQELNPGSTGWLGPTGVQGVPQLSADGRTVALIGNPSEATNVFVAQMGPGSGSGLLRQLTQEVQVRPSEPEKTINQEPYVPLNGHVFDLAISPDGSRIAFVTARQRFPLAPPNLVTPVPASLGLVEAYLIDLKAESLRRVTHGYHGFGEPSLAPTGSGQGGAGAAAPSLDADGRLLAFSSTAANLVEGDGNEAADAFVVADEGGATAAGASLISPLPPAPRPRRGKRLLVTAASLPDGDVRLTVTVPGPGQVKARAGGAPASSQQSQRLAAAAGRARGEGPLPLLLRLPHRFQRWARSREGLYATARVAFRGSGGKTLRSRLEVRFHVHPRRGRGRR